MFDYSDYLTFNIEEMRWEKNTVCTEGVIRKGNEWWYIHFVYGSHETVGPFKSQEDAKIAYLEQRLRSCWEWSNDPV